MNLPIAAIQSLLEKGNPLADMPLAERNKWVVALHAAGIESYSPPEKSPAFKALKSFYDSAKQAALDDTKIEVDKDGVYSAQQLAEMLDKINTVIQELSPGVEKTSIYRVRTEESKIRADIAALLGYSSFEKLTEDEKTAKREEMLKGFKSDIEEWQDKFPKTARINIQKLLLRVPQPTKEEYKSLSGDEKEFFENLRNYLKVKLNFKKKDAVDSGVVSEDAFPAFKKLFAERIEAGPSYKDIYENQTSESVNFDRALYDPKNDSVYSARELSGKNQHVDFSDVLGHIQRQKRDWAFCICEASKLSLSKASPAVLEKLRKVVEVGKDACTTVADKQYWQTIINTIQGAELKLKGNISDDPVQSLSGESGYGSTDGEGYSRLGVSTVEALSFSESFWPDFEEGMRGKYPDYTQFRIEDDMRNHHGADNPTNSEDPLPELNFFDVSPSSSFSGDEEGGMRGHGTDDTKFNNEDDMWDRGDGTHHSFTDPNDSLPPSPSGSPSETYSDEELPTDPVLPTASTVVGLLTHIQRLDQKTHLPANHWYRTLNEVAGKELQNKNPNEPITPESIEDHIKTVGKKLGLDDKLLGEIAQEVVHLDESKPKRNPPPAVSNRSLTKTGSYPTKIPGAGETHKNTETKPKKGT